MDIINEAKQVFDIEIQALEKTRNILGQTFVDIVGLITTCKGKVIITGMGKPGHIATKLVATFASLGTPSFYLHPGEAMHGDLGMISANDLIIAISYSGESDEIIQILPNIKMIGSKIIAITGNAKSSLAKAADIAQILPEFAEACHLGLAPTSSTTAALCYGDALAIVASNVYGFGAVDFGKFHPAGALGKKLVMRVDDLMATGENNPIISVKATLQEAIIELSEKRLAMVSVVDDKGLLCGIVTDGDLRRQLKKGTDIYHLQVMDIMSSKPKTIEKGKLAIEALNMMKEHRITCLPVVEDGRPIGAIIMQIIVSAGIL